VELESEPDRGRCRRYFASAAAALTTDGAAKHSLSAFSIADNGGAAAALVNTVASGRERRTSAGKRAHTAANRAGTRPIRWVNINLTGEPVRSFRPRLTPER